MIGTQVPSFAGVHIDKQRNLVVVLADLGLSPV